MDTVKFRKEVPEEVREEVRDFMHAKAVCEAMTGVAASIDDLYSYLFEKGFYMTIHVYGFEIMTLADWVKEELKEYPDQHTRDILRKHLVEHGISEEKADELLNDVKE